VTDSDSRAIESKYQRDARTEWKEELLNLFLRTIDFPDGMCASLVYFLSRRMLQFAIFLSEINTSEKKRGGYKYDTLCSSQGTPSTIYLKQK
jgi:hypothetical protein